MNESKKYIMTYDGVKKLEAELEHLKTVKRKEITAKIVAPIIFRIIIKIYILIFKPDTNSTISFAHIALI